jgi:hypothetical protein
MFNPYANGNIQRKMVRKYGVGCRADGARQTMQLTGRKEDVGTHNPPTYINYECHYQANARQQVRAP